MRLEIRNETSNADSIIENPFEFENFIKVYYYLDENVYDVDIYNQFKFINFKIHPIISVELVAYESLIKNDKTNYNVKITFSNSDSLISSEDEITEFFLYPQNCERHVHTAMNDLCEILKEYKM